MEKNIGAFVQMLPDLGMVPADAFQTRRKTGLTYQQTESRQRTYLVNYLNSFGHFDPNQVQEYVNKLDEKDIQQVFQQYLQYHDVASIDKDGKLELIHVQQRPTQTYITFVVYYEKAKKKIERVTIVDDNTTYFLEWIRDAFFYIIAPSNIIKVIVLDGQVLKLEEVDTLPSEIAKDDVRIVINEYGTIGGVTAGLEFRNRFIDTLKGHGIRVKLVESNNVINHTFATFYNLGSPDPGMTLTFNSSHVKFEYLSMYLTLRVDFSTETPFYWIDPEMTYVVPWINKDHGQWPIVTYFHTSRGDQVRFFSFSSSFASGNSHFGLVSETDPEQEYENDNQPMPVSKQTAFQHTNAEYMTEGWTFPNTSTVNGYQVNGPLDQRARPILLTLTLPDKPTDNDQLYGLHIYDPDSYLTAIRDIDLMIVHVHCLFRNGPNDVWRHSVRQNVFFGIDPLTKRAVHLPIFSFGGCNPQQYMPPTMATKVYKT